MKEKNGRREGERDGGMEGGRREGEKQEEKSNCPVSIGDWLQILSRQQYLRILMSLF